MLEYLTETDLGAAWAGRRTAFLSPHKDFDAQQVPATRLTQHDRQGRLQRSTVFRFDGSDQMPGEVGAGTFWKDMIAWISGQQDLDTDAEATSTTAGPS